MALAEPSVPMARPVLRELVLVPTVTALHIAMVSARTTTMTRKIVAAAARNALRVRLALKGLARVPAEKTSPSAMVSALTTKLTSTTVVLVAMLVTKVRPV